MPSRLPLLAALLATVALASADEVAYAPTVLPSYAKDVRPLLETYCIDCHGGESTKGEIDLARLKDESEALRELKTWRAGSSRRGAGCRSSPAATRCRRRRRSSRPTASARPSSTGSSARAPGSRA